MRKEIVGLIVLAVVIAGVIWSRSITASAAADVTQADRAVQIGQDHIMLSIAPRPVVPMTPVRMRVLVESNGVAETLESGELVLEMAMPMGRQRYPLEGVVEGWQEAEVVLPFCISGESRWYAHVEGKLRGRRVSATFQFDVHEAASR